MSGSIGGVTVGNDWMRNNPDLRYPENHETMNDDELLKELRAETKRLSDNNIINDLLNARAMEDINKY